MESGSGHGSVSLALPKGGGAVKSIGETFQPNLFTGTGNFKVPIFTSPGRQGFGPELGVSYSSGAGNGLFGLGWGLSLPSVTLKTEKGLPRYRENDIFVLSGAEDLVPVIEPARPPVVAEVQGQPAVTFAVRRYRPRTEGLFARIERWQRVDTDGTVVDTHWRAITRDNVINLYGRTAAARIADPSNPAHIYSWLLEETLDPKGNHIAYEYASDGAQRYPRRLYYGNLARDVEYPGGGIVGARRQGSVRANAMARVERRYVFEVVFDYGDLGGAYVEPGTAPDVFDDTSPPLRTDAFSTYRAGFEVRTRRRCERVLMFHHFAELGGPTLVRSTDFTYATDPDTHLSFLQAVTNTGYRAEGGGVIQASTPPVTFEYSRFTPGAQRYQSLEATGGDMPPQSLDTPDFALVDLFGDGLPDVLHAGPGGFRYWRNRGNGVLDRPRFMADVPLGLTLSEPGVSLGDMNGDGRLELIVHRGPVNGFFESTPDGAWNNYRHYENVLSVGLGDPNVRLLDLTGDGRSDVLMTRDHHFVWFPCLGEQGFDAPQYVPRVHDLAQFPDVFFGDPSGRVRLADMTGDGLNDIVMIQGGRIDYWPNLGYGKFGPRHTTEVPDASGLDRHFNPKRLFLTDLNGTGCADLVYVDVDRVHFWFNRSGNGWSGRRTIHGTPLTTDRDAISFADVFGTGTSTLVWSFGFSGQPGGNYKALDFCGGIKPYVLTSMSNNMGATTRVAYGPSTAHFLEDQRAGRPWFTTLPFPVQVLDKIEVIDHISRTKLVTTFRYHHGYYDGHEREFRGFGCVDQYDTEQFEIFAGAGLHGDGVSFDNADPAYHAPPVVTRNWFHTGVYYDLAATRHGVTFDHRELTRKFREDEYYALDPEAFVLDEHDVMADDTPREAYRALRGSLLRTEVYAEDGTEKAKHPYVVTEHRYRITRLQPASHGAPGVYLASPFETFTFHYERDPGDPRVEHSMVADVDRFGNVAKTIAIAYGRRGPGAASVAPAIGDRQRAITVVATENAVTNAIDDADDYRTPLPCETRTYELTGFAPGHPDAGFLVADFVIETTAASGSPEKRMVFDLEIPYESNQRAGKLRRLLRCTQTMYRPQDFGEAAGSAGALLTLGVVDSLALPGESYTLAFTDGLAQEIFVQGARVSASEIVGLMTDSARHVRRAGGWWAPSGRAFLSHGAADTAAHERTYAEQHFYLPCRHRDARHDASISTESFVWYDRYDLLQVQTRDPLGNLTTAGHRDGSGLGSSAGDGIDYRVLQPRRITDMNGNRTEVAFDALGLPVATAVQGKTQAVGDRLDGLKYDLDRVTVDSFYDAPDATAMDLLQRASTRTVFDLHRFMRTRLANPETPSAWEPVCHATISREVHASETEPANSSAVQIAFAYSDGYGRDVQRKAAGGASGSAGHWVTTGSVIFNNKGREIRRYEPFFSQDHRFQRGLHVGASSLLLYDPLDRLQATVHPNHTYEKSVSSAWRRETWDANDTLDAFTRFDPRSPAVLPDHRFSPVDDPDVGPLFARLAPDNYLPTWFDSRLDPIKAQHQWPDMDSAGAAFPEHALIRAIERETAEKAARHASTPAIFHTDSAGRTLASIADNGNDDTGSPQLWQTTIDLDVQGWQREVRDPLDGGDGKGRVVARYAYDMLGNRVYQATLDGGERWILCDAVGDVIRTWDARQHVFTFRYDPLRRLRERHVAGGADGTLNHTYEKIVYGEGQSFRGHTDEELNLRGRQFLHMDTAGHVRFELYDFKGNLLRSSRQFLEDYKHIADWSQHPAPPLEPEVFLSASRYDALNRVVQVIAPHLKSAGSAAQTALNVTQPRYNRAGQVERVDVWLSLDAEPSALLDHTSAAPRIGVESIQYNARGQRITLAYKNGVTTRYRYDASTFKLAQLYSSRGPTYTRDCDAVESPGAVMAAPDDWPRHARCGIQNIRYFYDPCGNMTHSRDAAQQAIYFRNQQIDPDCAYTYDPLYRLIEATGREHLGQMAGVPVQATNTDLPRMQEDMAAGDGRAMGRYAQRYNYDAAGNFLSVSHFSHDLTLRHWMRTFEYSQTSPFEPGDVMSPGRTSNRLSRAPMSGGAPPAGDDFTYDTHGNITRMPHLPVMRWDFLDRLVATARQVISAGGTPETTWYVYDASGRRARKITERAVSPEDATLGILPSRSSERRYLADVEVYREFSSGSGPTLERESLHVTDGQQRVAIVDAKRLPLSAGSADQNRSVRFQLANLAGSASIELDEYGELLSYEEYYAFGSTSYQATKSQLRGFKRYRYVGKERDTENDLYYHGARYYAPWLGRWTSTDPMLANNLFVYCRNNPLNFIDPGGAQEVPVQSAAPNVCQQPPAQTPQPPAECHPDDLQSHAPGAAPDAPAQEPDWSTKIVNGWMEIRTALTDAVREKGAYERAVRDTENPQPANHPALAVTDSIVRATPEVSANSFLFFAGAMKSPRLTAAPSGPPSKGAPAAEAVPEAPAAPPKPTEAPPAAPRQSPPPLPEAVLVERARVLHEELVLLEAAEKGRLLYPKLYRLKMANSATSLVQAEVAGSTVRIVNTTSVPHFKLLSKYPSLLGQGEVLGSAPASGSWAANLAGKGRFTIHAEQLGVNDALRMGATKGTAASFPKGCLVCQSLISEFPGFTHANPKLQLHQH